MWTVMLSVIAYVYGFFLTALFFSKALKIRYSAKKTAILTGIFIALLCVLKLPGLYKGVNANVNILMILQAVLLILYMLLVYRGTIVQTILAMILNMLSLAVAESLTMYLLRMGGIYGNRAMEAGTAYTIFGTLIMIPLQVIVYYADCYLWNRFKNIRWHKNTHQIFCLLLPVGQCFFVEAMIQEDMVVMNGITWLLFWGLLLSVITEIGVFELLNRSEERYRLETELRETRHYYEMEQIRYEQLKEMQEETARIRHDFQNYLLVLRNMEENRP